jgi:putative DNA primase/helicase
MNAIIKPDSTPNPVSMCSGLGQYHTDKDRTDHNGIVIKGKTYLTISFNEILHKVMNPTSCSKEKARWIIFSDLLSRESDKQRESGVYYAAWCDFDNHTDLDAIKNVILAKLSCFAVVYSSRSATIDKQKYRVIIPFAYPANAIEWQQVSSIINDIFERAGIIPDRVTERFNQVCYLPNKGDFYQYHINHGFNELDWKTAFSKELTDKQNQAQADQERIAQIREQSRLKAIERMETGTNSPIDAFNAAYPVEQCLEMYGYRKNGKKYLSPNSESGAAGVSIKGNKWLSSHSSDAGIGKPNNNGGCSGDAFDLFTWYEHGGNRNAAIKAAGDMFTTNNGKTITKANQAAFKSDSKKSKTSHSNGAVQKKNSRIEKNPTLPTQPSLNKDSILHQSCTNPTPQSESYTNSAQNSTEKPKTEIKKGDFVYFNEDGKPIKIVESKAAKILGNWMSEKNYAFCSTAQTWHTFNGYCWQPLATDTEPTKEVLNALYVGTEPVGFKPGYARGATILMLQAGLIQLPPEPMGKIPFKNGLLDITTRTLEPISKNNALTWAIPHDYHVGTNCQAFMQWINLATDHDQGLIQLIRAFIYACLMGMSQLQKFLQLLGPGGTGKSTFIRLLFAILGETNCTTTDLRHLEENKFETAGLYVKRLVAITDSNRYGGSVNVLKALTGQDPIRNERKNVQQTGTFIYSGMVLIASNEPLASTDYTSGFERRRLVIKFERRFTPDEKLVFMSMGGEDQLHIEIPAIINWALELDHDQVTRIFMNPPRKANEAAFESLTAQNPVAEWITDNLIPDPTSWLQIGNKTELKDVDGFYFDGADSKLYPNYLQWCKQNNRTPLALRRFRHAAIDMLRTMGINADDKRTKQGQSISGVRIKLDFELPYNWQV